MKLHQKYILASMVAAAVAISPAMADDEHKATGSKQHKDEKFAQQAFDSNMMEIQMAQLGVQKAQNQQLKQFAQTLQADHTQASNQLHKIAQQLGVQTKSKEHGKHQAMMTKLQSASGQEFDREFTLHALRHHAKDVKMHEKASDKIQNAQLKQYVQTVLPKLRSHLEQAQTLASTVGIDQSTVATIMSEATQDVGGSESLEQDTSVTPSESESQPDKDADTHKGAGARALKDHEQSDK